MIRSKAGPKRHGDQRSKCSSMIAIVRERRRPQTFEADEGTNEKKRDIIIVICGDPRRGTRAKTRYRAISKSRESCKLREIV